MNDELASSPWLRWLANSFGALFVVFVVITAATAISVLRARCDGVSCTYVGVAWIFWFSALFLPTAVLGAVVRLSNALQLRFKQLVRFLFLVHLVSGLCLFCWWLFQRVHAYPRQRLVSNVGRQQEAS